MYSSKDLERLWFLYKSEGYPKGVSINSFYMFNNVLYSVSMTGIRMPKKSFLLK